MLSSVAIALRWKAAKALKFAQSKAEREQQQQVLDQGGGEGYSDVDDDIDAHWRMKRRSNFRRWFIDYHSRRKYKIYAVKF